MAGPLGLMTSEKRQHVDSFKRPTFEPSTEVGIRSNLQEDVYMVFAGSVNGTEEAVYRFNINPLVWWVWFGGLVLALGGIITMWPGGGPTRSAAASCAGGVRSDPGRGGEGLSMGRAGGALSRRHFLLTGVSGIAASLVGQPLAATRVQSQPDSLAGRGVTGTLRDP